MYPTIDELNRMDAQAVFDHVARHLLTQGRQSVDADGRYCVYRASDGRSCAVGCLMPHDRYLELFEGMRINAIAVLFYGHPRVGDFATFAGRYGRLLARLQCLHDDSIPATWADGLRLVAIEFELSDHAIREHRPAVAVQFLKPILFLVAKAEHVVEETETA
jgi:hypothetical protein